MTRDNYRPFVLFCQDASAITGTIGQNWVWMENPVWHIQKTPAHEQPPYDGVTKSMTITASAITCSKSMATNALLLRFLLPRGLRTLARDRLSS